ncbi:MAG: LamG domain-containing protein [Actinomycetota bacterium]|nr:LamG domain-containing protein [Actinomycetota bacterium]
MTFRSLGKVALVVTTCMVAAGLQMPAALATTTTVALWHMNEVPGSTTMLDSSGHGNNGTLHNVLLGQPGVNAATDPTDLAYGFDGTTSYVQVPTSATLNPGTAALTITMSLKFTQLPARNHDYDLLRKGLAGTAGGDFKVELRDNGQAFCRFKGSSNKATLRKGPNLADGRWHVLECVKTDTNIQLIIDGATFTKSAKVGSMSNSSDVIVGAKPGDDFYKGTLDEVRLDQG